MKDIRPLHAALFFCAQFKRAFILNGAFRAPCAPLSGRLSGQVSWSFAVFPVHFFFFPSALFRKPVNASA
ncbi:hypothetical protein AD948_03655 [Acetobacter senegalensis]|uniref:Uncharacterized protein n=1 Tax=Acetobacter senegalensis TaxID=446692 RepID=A0A149U6H7_9PROT|nr:hypothetical protein AD948_03655 [Acetobacter senegalensis]